MTTTNIFHVESVEPCDMPRGVASGEWCRYVVASEHSRIVGRYRGSLRQAKRNAEGLVTDLNSRARGGKVPWAPRGRRRAS